MWLIGLLGIIAIALIVVVILKNRALRRAYLARRAELANLAEAAARQQAEDAIADWIKVTNPPGAKIDAPQPLGRLTAEFIAKYAEIASPNGAHHLGAKHLAQSQYRAEMLAIGKSDYMDICVRPGADTVYVIDGSEQEGELDDQYPSVLHLLIDYGMPQAGDALRSPVRSPGSGLSK